MSKRLNGKCLFFIAVLVFVFSVSSVSPAFAAADKPILGKPYGLVRSTNWRADEVGHKILAAGGNAIDAAAAVGYALAVVHPTAGNLGGGGFAVIHLANGESYALDFREMAPSGAFREMYIVPNNYIKPWDSMSWSEIMSDPANGIDWDVPSTYRARRFYYPDTPTTNAGSSSLNGYLAAGVPGTVAGLNEMVRRFGSGNVTLADILRPSINMAWNGFSLTPGTASSIQGSQSTFNRYAGSRKYFTKNGNGGETFAAGDVFKQQDLAKTLQRIADQGSDGFYKGLTADLIVADMPKYGGIMTHEDLANYKFMWRDPVAADYRGYRVISMSPPSSGGTHIIQMLNTIENENIGTLGFNSLRTIWLMTEAMRFAYADRAEWMGDPDYTEVPVQGLTDKAYGKQIYDEIIAYGFKARPSSDDLFVYGGLYKKNLGLAGPSGGLPGEGNETTHYSVIDSFGNAVGITYTINMGYGCKAAVDGAGFFMNNEMDDFMSLPGVPNGFGLIQGEANCVEPGKRPLSSMSPTIVLSSDKSIFLVTGSPGGSQIINTTLHSVVNAIDHGMNVSELVAAPRFHMQWQPDRLQYESLFGFTNDTLSKLREMGYTLAASSQGDISAVMRNPATGEITGVNDPRTYDIPPSLTFDELMEYVKNLP